MSCHCPTITCRIVGHNLGLCLIGERLARVGGYEHGPFFVPLQDRTTVYELTGVGKGSPLPHYTTGLQCWDCFDSTGGEQKLNAKCRIGKSVWRLASGAYSQPYQSSSPVGSWAREKFAHEGEEEDSFLARKINLDRGPRNVCGKRLTAI